MKFKFFKKIKFPTIILVSSALIIFLSLSMIYLFGKIGADYIQINKYKSDSNDELLGNEEQYYFKKAEKIIDPFITRNPDFDRLLAGPIIGNNDPTMGDREARVTIVFYSDCSYCQIQEQILKKILQKYEYQVRLIWKDYPKNDKDSRSYKSAIAARCAQAQNSFWPYHDFLYEFSDRLNTDTYLEIAEILNLDKDKFTKCLDGEESQKLINKNMEEADLLDIAGIPFMYINTQEIMGQIDFETLDQMITHELSK